MKNSAYPFGGFVEPKENWSKLPHQLIAAFPIIETLGEALVILYVLRHTWGFHDEDKRITTDEFERGRKYKDGTRMDNGIGLKPPTIRNGIKRAVKHGFIEVEVDAHDKARIRKYYRLRLVVKDLPSASKPFSHDSKSLSNRWQRINHRTEKETIERNHQGRNYRNAPFNGRHGSRHLDEPLQPSFSGEFIERMKGKTR